MKKLLLVVAFAAVGTFAFAQKPVAGDRTAEVGLNLQTGTAPISYNVPELRFRMFKSDDMAYRLRANIGSMSRSYSQDIGGVAWEAKDNSGFNIALAAGVEKHFAGTKRLSPYVGAEVGINFGTGRTVEATNDDAPVFGPTFGSGITSGNVAAGNKYEQKFGSTFGLGIGAVMGADYYVADGVYVGVEFGLGLINITSTGEGEITTQAGSAKGGKSSSFDLFGVTGSGVRLGYKF